MRVPLYRHNLINCNTEQLAEQFKSTLDNMQISTGPISTSVAQQFAEYLAARYCLLTSSWTAGMMSVLIALDIGPGDEVIIPALTFAATANAVKALRAQPIFVDIDPATKLMDIPATINSVTKNTKAVIPVHLYGQMVDVEALRSLLPIHVNIIEDAAHAIEAKFGKDRPGAHSDAAVFSFYQSKNMTTGEGGAIVTNSEKLYNAIKLSYRHGVDMTGYARHNAERFYEPDVVTLGIKANMPDLLALLLPPQIAAAKENSSKRQAIADRYRTELSSLVELPIVAHGITHANHIFAIGVDPTRRQEILDYMDNNGVRLAIHFKSLNEMSYYSNHTGSFPNAHNWGISTISLPIFPGLTEQEQNYVIDKLKEIL